MLSTIPNSGRVLLHQSLPRIVYFVLSVAKSQVSFVCFFNLDLPYSMKLLLSYYFCSEYFEAKLRTLEQNISKKVSCQKYLQKFYSEHFILQAYTKKKYKEFILLPVKDPQLVGYSEEFKPISLSSSTFNTISKGQSKLTEGHRLTLYNIFKAYFYQFCLLRIGEVFAQCKSSSNTLFSL